MGHTYVRLTTKCMKYLLAYCTHPLTHKYATTGMRVAAARHNNTVSMMPCLIVQCSPDLKGNSRQAEELHDSYHE